MRRPQTYVDHAEEILKVLRSTEEIAVNIKADSGFECSYRMAQSGSYPWLSVTLRWDPVNPEATNLERILSLAKD